MYVREFEDKTLTFQVSGKLWMRSLIMRDLETGSEWSHLLGKAMAGELKGRKLKPIVTDMVTWSVWKQQHPETTILNMPATVNHYTSQFYRKPEDFVFGFEVDGNALALPMPQLMQHPVHSFTAGSTRLLATFDAAGAVTHLFEPTIDGRTLQFKAVNKDQMSDQQTNSRWEILTGSCVDGELKGKLLPQRVGIMSFRFAWENFHPDSKDVTF